MEKLTDTDITKAMEYIDRHNCAITPNAQGSASRLRAHALLGRTMTPGDQGRHTAEEDPEMIEVHAPKPRKKVGKVDATG